MPVMTLAEAESHLDAWTAANLAVSKGQSYSIGSRTLTRADVNVIRHEIAYWSRVVDSITAKNAGNSTNPGVRIAKWA